MMATRFTLPYSEAREETAIRQITVPEPGQVGKGVHKVQEQYGLLENGPLL